MIVRSKGKAKVIQDIAIDGKSLYIQFAYGKNQRIEVYKKTEDGKWEYERGKDYKNRLGHGNGLCVVGKNLYSVRGHSRKAVVISKHNLNVLETRNAPVKTTGAIGYNGDEWAFSSGDYICYGTFNKIKKKVRKPKPRKYQQGLCYWKNYIFNCISVGKKKNYIQIYRDKKLWTVLKNVHNGFELEGCAVDDDGRLYICLNRRHKTDDRIVTIDWRGWL